jgi:hypothetical protein
MRRLIVPLLMFSLAAPALAEVRPMQRPAAITAFADATALAPRATPRPLRSPDILPGPAPLSLVFTADDLPRRLAQEPVAPDRMAAVDPPLRAALARRAMVVTTSAANAPRLPVAAAAVLSAFQPAPGPGVQPRARPLPPLQSAAFTPRLRPVPRPATRAAPGTGDPAPTAGALLRPLKRPADLMLRRPEPEAEAEAEVVKAAAVRINPGEQLVKPKKGSLCGDRRIRGQTVPPIPAKVKGCGIADPVKVTEVDGVALVPAATIDCDTAIALTSWVRNGLKPAVGKRGVAQLNVAASYACRSRNNIRGARISEHGRGRAIDIFAVVLGNGQVLDVLRDYRRDAGRVLRAAHKAACGPFGTTLGPGSDGYHENHLHFDTARHRGGPYCR